MNTPFTLDETGEFGYVYEIAVSPDNQQTVLLDDKGMILAVNLANGTVVKKIEDYINNTQTPLWLEYDPDGKYVYYIFRDVSSMGVQSAGLNSTSWQEASLHDALIIPYFPWKIGVFSPKLSTTGYKFGYFTSYGSKTVAAMDYSTLAPRFEIRRTDSISAFAFSPDGSKVVMAGTEPTELEVWKVDTIKAPEQTFRTPNKLWSVAVTSDGKSSFGIDEKGTLFKWQSGQPEPVVTREGFWPLGTGIEFTDDGQTLRLFTNETTTINNEVFEFDPNSGDLKAISPNPYVLEEMKDEYPQAIALSPDKTLMAVIYNLWVDDDIRLFDYSTGKFLKKIPSKMDFDNVDFTPDGQALIGYGLPDGPVQVIDLDSGKVLEKFPVEAEFENGVTEMRLSGDKATMILAGGDGYLKAYKTDTFELIQAMDESVWTYWFAISNDGSRVAYLTFDGKLGLWDIPSNTLLPEFELSGYTDFLMSYSNPQLVFSPDNSAIGAIHPGWVYPRVRHCSLVWGIQTRGIPSRNAPRFSISKHLLFFFFLLFTLVHHQKIKQPTSRPQGKSAQCPGRGEGAQGNHQTDEAQEQSDLNHPDLLPFSQKFHSEKAEGDAKDDHSPHANDKTEYV